MSKWQLCYKESLAGNGTCLQTGFPPSLQSNNNNNDNNDNKQTNKNKNKDKKMVDLVSEVETEILGSATKAKWKCCAYSL